MTEFCNKKIRYEYWTPEEDEMLSEMTKTQLQNYSFKPKTSQEHGASGKDKIPSKCITYTTDPACNLGVANGTAKNTQQFEQYFVKRKMGHWTSEEDKQLLEIVKKCGPYNWEKMSTYHPTRNGKQMRVRWLSHLRGVNKKPFSDEEVATVYYLHDIESKGWAEIAKRLGNGRAANSCKNVYHNVVYKKLRSCPESASKYTELYFAALVRELSATEKMTIELLVSNAMNVSVDDPGL
ncbi:9218_t:CDS:2 [Paraglomus occultum]|uniref:9218_t:CDS:1 n=1 Tax=Paraglomus occultum TaxID=144539 RepID=A0A9N9CFP7_9GLOM|nr:9218_t:CDS:2 [Paraglomus occultum]